MCMFVHVFPAVPPTPHMVPAGTSCWVKGLYRLQMNLSPNISMRSMSSMKAGDEELLVQEIISHYAGTVWVMGERRGRQSCHGL